jgi:hypothetical protein
MEEPEDKPTVTEEPTEKPKVTEKLPDGPAVSEEPEATKERMSEPLKQRRQKESAESGSKHPKRRLLINHL